MSQDFFFHAPQVYMAILEYARKLIHHDRLLIVSCHKHKFYDKMKPEVVYVQKYPFKEQ